MADDDSTSEAKRPGRPLKVDGPRFPQQEVDRLLVFGELVDSGDGSGPTVVFPSYRELAQRYDVSHSVIAEYAKKHNCIRRREQAQARVEARTDQKLIELRATAIAISKDDTLRIIDAYILGFEKAVADGRVRFENPSDFNTMVRLKQFIEGGADSRQEIHAALSLESLQARHKQMLQGAGAASAAERGDRESASKASGSELDDQHQPAPLATPQEHPDNGFAMEARASTANDGFGDSNARDRDDDNEPHDGFDGHAPAEGEVIDEGDKPSYDDPPHGDETHDGGLPDDSASASGADNDT